MKFKVIFSIVVITIILTFGCKDKSKEEILTPNMEPIEYLSFKDKGCQTSLNEYPRIASLESRQLEILSKHGSQEGNFWEIIGDSLIITTILNTYCNAKMTDSVEVTENKIQIYIKDTAENKAKCTCIFQEEFSFKAEPSKTIELAIYFKSNGSDEYIIIGQSTIKI